jgi:hypothetical protein
MRRSSSDTYFQAIARDVAVKADYLPDRTTTNARLGEALQRLYAPVEDTQPDRLSHLLMALDRQSGRG